MDNFQIHNPLLALKALILKLTGKVDTLNLNTFAGYPIMCDYNKFKTLDLRKIDCQNFQINETDQYFGYSTFSGNFASLFETVSKVTYILLSNGVAGFGLITPTELATYIDYINSNFGSLFPVAKFAKEFAYSLDQMSNPTNVRTYNVLNMETGCVCLSGCVPACTYSLSCNVNGLLGYMGGFTVNWFDYDYFGYTYKEINDNMLLDIDPVDGQPVYDPTTLQLGSGCTTDFTSNGANIPLRDVITATIASLAPAGGKLLFGRNRYGYPRFFNLYTKLGDGTIVEGLKLVNIASNDQGGAYTQPPNFSMDLNEIQIEQNYIQRCASSAYCQESYGFWDFPGNPTNTQVTPSTGISVPIVTDLPQLEADYEWVDPARVLREKFDNLISVMSYLSYAEAFMMYDVSVGDTWNGDQLYELLPFDTTDVTTKPLIQGNQVGPGMTIWDTPGGHGGFTAFELGLIAFEVGNGTVLQSQYSLVPGRLLKITQNSKK